MKNNNLTLTLIASSQVRLNDALYTLRYEGVGLSKVRAEFNELERLIDEKRELKETPEYKMAYEFYLKADKALGAIEDAFDSILEPFE